MKSGFFVVNFRHIQTFSVSILDNEHVFVWWIAIKLPKESDRSEANF